MPEYDLNVCAWQIVGTIEANTEEEAVEKAFYEAFGASRDSFATTEYEVCRVKSQLKKVVPGPEPYPIPSKKYWPQG